MEFEKRRTPPDGSYTRFDSNSKKEDRIKKYLWYMEKDPEGKYGIMAQYQSILDENPNLKLWKE